MEKYWYEEVFYLKLKEIRMARGLTQGQAARDLNLSQVVYGRYENGTREPSNLVLTVMADYFQVSVDELLGRPEPQERNAQEDEDVMEIREQLLRDPNARILFQAARKAKPEHIRATIAMLKSLETLNFPDVD